MDEQTSIRFTWFYSVSDILNSIYIPFWEVFSMDIDLTGYSLTDNTTLAEQKERQRGVVVKLDAE